MSLSSVNNIKDSMARLNVLFSDMNAELQRVKNYYDGMIQEAQHSFVDTPLGVADIQVGEVRLSPIGTAGAASLAPPISSIAVR